MLTIIRKSSTDAQKRSRARMRAEHVFQDS